ncbi:PREDICTED: ankyrin-3-like [Priapulus caudatus]|uniref:Ankyrin-3-like n=1 Tax=Priapulus caudatus TaxID=37621 RepID=A0ABM1EJ86_PRICU|nr:PREDICTED: ankyrin-3-like [Priapulus caudatus]
MAMRNGKEAVVRMLLSHGASANANTADSQGLSTLYQAARFDQLDIERLRLEAGADPNVAETQTGKTPLMSAVREGEEAVVRMLLSHGANVNAADQQGRTSLYHAACSGQLDIVRLLLEAGTSLHMAAYSGRLDIVRLLLEAGADPNVAEAKSGVTPLMRAVTEAIVQMLLSHGVDVNAGADPNVAETQTGKTPLMKAAEKRGSFTALHYSCDRLRTEMITRLLKHGADPNLVDYNKRTPLTIIGSQVRSHRMGERAAQAGSVVQAASALLQTCESAGVLLQVNTRDSKGDTPLHSFCRVILACKDNVYAREREGCVQIVHALLFNHGAHVDVVNARGETPYKLWRRIYPTRFSGNVVSSDEIHGRMSAQYYSLKCYCARVIVRHSVEYENRLPPSLVEFVRAHARPT